ncbi:hypothetical protein Tco_1526684 [Tanacetum coccineum]
MESLNSNSQERELHQLQQMQHKAKKSCMKSFRLLHSHLKVLSIDDLKRPGSKGGYEQAFASLFDQDVQTFTGTMLLNLDQLEHQLDKEEFQEIGSMDAFRVLMTQFQMFIKEQYYFVGFDDLMISKYFLAYTQTEMQECKVVSSKAMDVDLVVMESSRTESRKQDTSSSSGNYLTHVVDANIEPKNDQVSLAEVDSNTTPDSTNMCHRGGEIDQDAKHYQVKSPLLNAEFFKTKDMVEKEVYNELSNRFLQHEKHYISLEISIQQKE